MYQGLFVGTTQWEGVPCTLCVLYIHNMWVYVSLANCMIVHSLSVWAERLLTLLPTTEQL